VTESLVVLAIFAIAASNLAFISSMPCADTVLKSISLNSTSPLTSSEAGGGGGGAGGVGGGAGGGGDGSGKAMTCIFKPWLQ
jgi:uncharacterized membrane protein